MVTVRHPGHRTARSRFLQPPARQDGHNRHLPSPVRGPARVPGLAARSARVGMPEYPRVPTLLAPALKMERFRDMRLAFHPVMECRREALRSLSSSGRSGGGVPSSAMVAG